MSLVDSYRDLQEDLDAIRTNHGLGTALEDEVLSSMEKLWWKMDEEEREEISE
tara:strand:+ start:443 stop:601 length:159 start_codon:yes stop_codon:yes gene_type:complete